VFFSFTIVTEDKVALFINANQVNPAAHEYLDNVVSIHPYESFLPYLKDCMNELQIDKDNVRLVHSILFYYNDSLDSVQKMWIGERASLAVAEAIGRDRYFSARTPLTDLKAIKNATELEGFRQSHIRDGVALARYFAWLEAQLNNGFVLNESQGADQLEKFRSSVVSLTLIEKCS